jgi:hypothetical protein
MEKRKVDKIFAFDSTFASSTQTNFRKLNHQKLTNFTSFNTIFATINGFCQAQDVELSGSDFAQSYLGT